MATDTDTRHESALQGASALWYVSYDGVVRDKFWSPALDPDEAHAEYCDARRWLQRDRVVVF